MNIHELLKPPHAPNCPCLDCLRQRGSGGLFGSLLIAAAKVVIPLLTTPLKVDEPPPPLEPVDPVSSAKRVHCEVVSREAPPPPAPPAPPRPHMYMTLPALPESIEVEADEMVTAPPATVSEAMTGTTILLDVEIRSFPRCSACKHPYVLRRTLVHVGGDVVEQWSWWRDCKDKDAGAEIVDNQPKKPARKQSKKPRKPRPKRTKEPRKP